MDSAVFINPDKPRLEPSDLELIRIGYGGHETRNLGCCAMEAAAWLAGEPHSTNPACVAEPIREFVLVINDMLPTEYRQHLKTIIPDTVGTAAKSAEGYRLEAYGLAGLESLEFKRALIATDAAIREIAPLFFHGRNLPAAAQAYKSLPAIETPEAAGLARNLARTCNNPFGTVTIFCQAIYDASNDAVCCREPLPLIYNACAIIRRAGHEIGWKDITPKLIECIRRMCAV